MQAASQLLIVLINKCRERERRLKRREGEHHPAKKRNPTTAFSERSGRSASFLPSSLQNSVIFELMDWLPCLPIRKISREWTETAGREGMPLEMWGNGQLRKQQN